MPMIGCTPMKSIVTEHVAKKAAVAMAAKAVRDIVQPGRHADSAAADHGDASADRSHLFSRERDPRGRRGRDSGADVLPHRIHYLLDRACTGPTAGEKKMRRRARPALKKGLSAGSPFLAPGFAWPEVSDDNAAGSATPMLGDRLRGMTRGVRYDARSSRWDAFPFGGRTSASPRATTWRTTLWPPIAPPQGAIPRPRATPPRQVPRRSVRRSQV